MTSSDTSVAQSLTQLPGYTWGECLYQSAKTVVYRAREVATGRAVVIKSLAQDYPSFNDLVHFRNQYTITKNLSIPGVLKTLDLLPFGNSYALIMEDVGGISLQHYDQQHDFELTEVLAIALQLADILYHLHHQRVIHKDIKPANILIHPESKRVNLIDFSIASLLPKETQAIQSPKRLEGTLTYLAPEQTGRMNRAIDYRTDFYSLGVTLYELLTGKPPFVSQDPLELIHCQMARLATPVDQVNPAVPSMVSAIIAKLMAKNAEDRYQSALGLKYDLEQCLIPWKEQGEITDFQLGQQDFSDRFLIPEKLYGRETEVQSLLEAFDRVSQGTSELMLVAGFSGIGKTAVVNEVHKPIVRQRGYFIKGKFDQFNRNIPLSAFVQAFRDLMGQLLSESDEAIADWRSNILTVVGDNGQVLIDVIPELEHIIGQQPPVPELSGSAAQNRFNRLFQKFIELFTTPAHPLVIFVDDLQWADTASLSLIQVLMTESQSGNLLLLGAYRDNEVFPSHPLMLNLAELEKKAVAISSMTLAPLSITDINRLLAETLKCSVELAQPLTELIYQRTKGNPFFTTQFLKGLYDDQLIKLNPKLGYWECDLTQVYDAALKNDVADDVVQFMVSRLQKLPESTSTVLKLAACIGNQFDLETLAIACESSVEKVAADLWAALQEGLIIPMTDAYKFYQESVKDGSSLADVVVGYRFLHDRVQQAAYSLIPDDYQKKSTHLKIGKLLLAHQSTDDREENIFNILNHLMMGIEVDPDAMPATELAEISLLAGMKAKLSVAYKAATDYFAFGLSRLPDTAWTSHYSLMRDLNREYGECDYFLGQFDTSEARLNDTLSYLNEPLDIAQIYEILMTQRVTRGVEIQSSLAFGLKGLAVLGMDIPTDPAMLADVTDQELQTVQQIFEQMSPEELLGLPTISDPTQRSCMKLLGSLWTASYISGDGVLNRLTTLRTINLSLEYGQAEGSSLAYSCYGMIVAAQGNYEQAYAFGKVALKLDRKLNNRKFMGKNNNLFSHAISPYMRPLKENLALYQESVMVCPEVGDFIYGAWAGVFILWTHLLQGTVLSDIELESQKYLSYMHGFNDQNLLYVFQLQQTFVNSLLEGGQEETLLSYETLSYEGFRENETLNHWCHNQFDHGVNWYGFLVLYRLYLDRKYTQVIEVSQFIEATLPTNFGFFPIILYHLYYTLSLIAVFPDADTPTQQAYEKTIKEQQQIFETWSRTCPATFQHKYDLLLAEIARLNDDRLEAMECYDRSIAGAQANGFVQEEALANELAAQFYLDWGKEKIAESYMKEAYYRYFHWGATAKVTDLVNHYPKLLRAILLSSASSGDVLTTLMTITASGTASGTLSGTASTTATPMSTAHGGTRHTSKTINQSLDLASIFKASQALSSTIQLDELLDQLTQVILQNSGGDMCALLLSNEAGDWQVRAHATPDATTLCNEPLTHYPDLPATLLQYVKNTQEVVAIDNLETDLPIIDDYLTQQQPKSILSLPILNQGHLIGILYLQNSLVSGVFTEERLLVINFLCTQAAISLENARLFQKSQRYAQQIEQSQLQLVQNEKMATLGNLIAGVAHEVNNPIGFLNGSIRNIKDYLKDLCEYLEVYQSQQPPNETVQESAEELDLDFILSDLPKLLDSMKVATDRIKGISTSLRTFSRADTESKVSANLHDGLRSTLLILKYRLKANENRPAIEVIEDYGNLPEIDCFPGQLNQVFMNILANAVDALDEASQGRSIDDLKANPNRITIRTEMNDNQVKIAIADNGPGIPESVKAKIFDHLFTTKEVGKGTGLGLAIARQIVEETHGGRLVVQSKASQGTEFCIYLPV